MTKRLDGSDDIEDVTPIEGKSEDISDLLEDIDSQIAAVTSEFDKDANDAEFKIKIYRVLEKEGKSAYLFNCQPEELPIMDRLRDEYGSGIYKARLYKNKKLMRQFSYQIEAPKNKPAPVVVQQPSNDMATILAAMNAQNDRNFNQMKELVVQMQAGNPGGMKFDLMGILTALPAAIAGLRALVPDNSAMMLKMIEIAANNGGGGGRETNMWDIAKEALNALPAIAEIAKTQGQQPAALPAPARIPIRAPVTANNPTPAPSPAPAASSNNARATAMQSLKPQVDMLVNAALKNSDPGIYADLIADNVPANVIRQYLMQETLFADLSQINPRVMEVQPWFMSLQKELSEILSEIPDESLTPGVVNTDTNNNATEQPSAAVPADGITEGGARS